MRLLCSMVFVFALSITSVFAQEPIVPIEERGTIDVPSLVIATAPSVPAAVEKAAVEAVKKVDLNVFELLPAADREQCDAFVWSTRLTDQLPPFRADAIRRCIFETKSAHERVADLFAKVERYDTAPANPLAIGLEGRTVRFGSARLPVDDVNKSLGYDARTCIDAAGRPIADCVQSEAIDPMRRYLSLRVDDSSLRTLNEASTAVTAATQPPTVTATAVASLATSWEAIVINAIADQMVVQLRGAAATRLLGVFGNSICRKDVQGTNVKSFFPETCNLLTHTQIDTSSSNAIAQIPGEFQRTLRNDTIASLPGLLSAAGGKDPMLATLGPVLVQFVAEGSAPLSKTASAAAQSYCDQNASAKPPDPRGTRACRTYFLLTAVGKAVATCDGQPANCVSNLIDVPYKDWKVEFDPVSAKTAAELYADVLALRDVYGTSKKDADARIALLLQVVKTFGEYSQNDQGAFVLLRKWDQKSYRWATTALTVYQVAQDFRRGYEPLDLANAVFANTLCVKPASSTAYDVGCALKLTAFTCQTMRDSLKATAAEQDLKKRLDTLSKDLAERVNKLADNDPLKAWAVERKLVEQAGDLASQTGPEFAALVGDVETAKKLAKKSPRTKDEEEQLDGLYNRIIDSVFTIWANVTGRTVRADDAERAKRLITNTGVCWRAAREKNYGTLANALYSVALDSGIGKPFPPAVERYRLLFTNMVAAQDPAAFKTAVESYLSHTAAPDAKFESKTGLWLTGLPGLGVRRAGSDGDVGIFAPVGIDWVLNPGLLDGRARLAVYGQLLDLGNLVKLKYDGDDATSGDVKFRDVWAPGLYLRYPWRSGFSVGAGGSYVPVTTSGDDEERTLKLRFNAFFAYDLSWFRLYGAGDPTLKDQTQLRPGLRARIRSWFGRK